jgi:hypothetical protein
VVGGDPLDGCGEVVECLGAGELLEQLEPACASVVVGGQLDPGGVAVVEVGRDGGVASRSQMSRTCAVTPNSSIPTITDARG